MALLFHEDSYPSNGQRKTGFDRYRELLDRDHSRFFRIDLLVLLGCLPYLFGLLLSFLTNSILVLLAACILGGCFAGPAIACMHDTILRSLRDAPGFMMKNFKKSLRQNWKAAIIPGIICCTILGFYLFMGCMLFVWSTTVPRISTILLYLVGILFFFLFFSTYWPQLVLFEQTNRIRIQNSFLFFLVHFGLALKVSLLQLLWWGITILLMPWSILLVPFLGLWFILFLSNFLLYDTMNAEFHIEEQISEHFPEQVWIYE